MGDTCYLVGAGLSKSLELPGRPIPLMLDFVSTMAHYLDNDVILTALAELENAGVFATRCDEASKLAGTLVGKKADRSSQNRNRFAKCLSERLPESIEDLIERSSRVGATSPSASVKDRFLFSINQLFSIVGWNINFAPLERFLRYQLKKEGGAHTFVSFNYDLILDRAVQRARCGDWHPAEGYGFRVPFYTTEEISSGNSPGVLPRARAVPFDETGINGGRIRIFKPHGSLNWLLPFEIPYRHGEHGLVFKPEPMVVPLEPDGVVRYWSTTADFKHIQCPGHHPHDYGIVIIPPTAAKQSDLDFLEKIKEREAEVISKCENIFVIGYSLPVTDANQELLIRSAVQRRSAGIQRLIVVNYHAAKEYFSRISELFSFPEDKLEIFNSGFAAFVSGFCAEDCV